MITKQDLDKDSKYYDNKNAKSSCPNCDSLDTYYYRNTLVCQDCGSEYFMKIMDKKKMSKLLKTASILGVLGLLFYFI